MTRTVNCNDPDFDEYMRSFLSPKVLLTPMVEAPREPTEAMLRAGALMTDEDDSIGVERARGVYWAMINAAV